MVLPLLVFPFLLFTGIGIRIVIGILTSLAATARDSLKGGFLCLWYSFGMDCGLALTVYDEEYKFVSVSKMESM